MTKVTPPDAPVRAFLRIPDRLAGFNKVEYLGTKKIEAMLF